MGTHTRTRRPTPQVDPVTLYALASCADTFIAAGVRDPYEFYAYVHVSQVGCRFALIWMTAGIRLATRLHLLCRDLGHATTDSPRPSVLSANHKEEEAPARIGLFLHSRSGNRLVRVSFIPLTEHPDQVWEAGWAACLGRALFDLVCLHRRHRSNPMGGQRCGRRYGPSLR